MPSIGTLAVTVRNMIDEYAIIVGNQKDPKKVKREKRLNLLLHLTGENVVIVPNNNAVGLNKRRLEKLRVKAFITGCTHNAANMYRLSCHVVRMIKEEFFKDALLISLVRENKLLLILKGSQAQRIVLKKHFPDLQDVIDNEFGIEGDNDATLLLDPCIHNRHQVLQDAIRCVKRAFAVFRQSSYALIVEELMKKCFVGTNLVPFAQRDRDYYPEGPEKESGTEQFIHSVHCHDIKIGDRTKFDLLRLMFGVKTPNQNSSSEFFDLSVPDLTDSAYDHFDMYQNLEYCEMIDVEVF